MEAARLVVLSMGGLLAQAFYPAHPARVLSLLLAACRPGDAPVFAGEQERAFTAARLKPLEEGRGIEEVAEALLPGLVGGSASAEARARVRASLLRLRRAAYAATLRARLDIEPFLDLGAVAAPALVVAGGEDRVALPEQMRALAAALPGGGFALIERAGHLVNIERPDEFNRIVLSFLDAQERSAASSPNGSGSADRLTSARGAG